jgi:hypothetical protein
LSFECFFVLPRGEKGIGLRLSFFFLSDGERIFALSFFLYSLTLWLPLGAWGLARHPQLQLLLLVPSALRQQQQQLKQMQQLARGTPSKKRQQRKTIDGDESD